MDTNKLENLLSLGEFGTLDSFFAKLDINQLSPDQQRIYVETLAGNMRPALAQVYYDKFSLENNDLLSRVFYLTKDFERAFEYAEDLYLKVDILIATNKLEEALTLLKQLPVDAKWHLYMGLVYGHLFDFLKAVECLQISVELYQAKNESAYVVQAMALLGNYTYQSGNSSEAEKIFKKVRRLSWQLNSYPETQGSCLINCAYFLLTRGEIFSTLRCLLKARHLMQRSPSSVNYARATLLLAYTLQDLGHFSRAINLLEELPQQSKRQMELDRLRYIAVCYAELGQSEKAEQYIQRAKNFADPSDPVAQLYLPIDEMKVLLLAHNTVQATSLAKKIIQTSTSQGNQEAVAYCQTHLGALTGNIDLTREAISYNERENLRGDLAINYLTLAKNQIEKVTSLLLACGSFQNPKHEAERCLLLATSYLHANQFIEAKSWLTLGKKLLLNRQCLVLQLLALKIEIELGFGDIPLSDLIRKYQSLSAKLTASLDLTLKRTLKNLRLNDDSFKIEHQQSVTKLDYVSAHAYRYSPDHVVIDLAHQEVIIGGHKIERLQKYPLLKSILFYLASNSDRTISKEEFALKVFEKISYDPRTDDNPIYVAINRLRKLIDVPDLVLNVGGQYQIGKTPQLLIFSVETSNYSA